MIARSDAVEERWQQAMATMAGTFPLRNVDPLRYESSRSIDQSESRGSKLRSARR